MPQTLHLAVEDQARGERLPKAPEHSYSLGRGSAGAQEPEGKCQIPSPAANWPQKPKQIRFLRHSFGMEAVTELLWREMRPFIELSLGPGVRAIGSEPQDTTTVQHGHPCQPLHLLAGASWRAASGSPGETVGAKCPERSCTVSGGEKWGDESQAQWY